MPDTKRPGDREPSGEHREAQGTKYKPVHPEDAVRKEEMNRIRGMQAMKDPEVGPTNHTSNPSG
ncbi:MAG TPA: hypothetical protein VGK74_03475 [Symbiobacteriaceae bacterium]|jgi:hypothetical protein